MPFVFQLIALCFLFAFASSTPIEAPVSSPIPVPTAAVRPSSSVSRTTPTNGTAISIPVTTPQAESPIPLLAPERCGQRDWTGVKGRLRSLVLDNSEHARWPARLLRAGFHDCYEGSCDGSLAHELHRLENRNIDVTIDLLRSSIRGTCVSLADAIKIGLELSMELMGAPELSCPKGTVDAEKAGPPREIPNRFQDAATILANFRGKGFTVEEAHAGNFGGHSVGGFDDSLFTPTVARYGNEFAKFMTQPFSNATGFNALRSDRTLLEADTSGHVQSFADDRAVLDKAFASFMLKLCSMSRD